MPSELAILVEAEARLDREIGTARADGERLEQAARDRIATADAALAADIARQQAEVAAAIARRTEEQLAALDDDALRTIERYTSANIDAVAERVLTELLALVTKETAS
jgi:hypothetical protein